MKAWAPSTARDRWWTTGPPAVSHTEERAWEAAVFVVVVATGIVLTAAKLGGPLGVDEGWTAGQYVLEPFRVAASKYDDPNNHLLHTLLAWGAHRTFGPSVVALRIPAFLSWCLLLLAVWWFVRKEIGWPAAALATTFVGTSRFLLEYGSSARGYGLVLLLFMLALLVGRTLVHRPGNNLRWALWAGLLALGFFAVPVMVFPASIVVAWMLLSRLQRNGARGMAAFSARTATWSVVAAVLGLLLYLPAMVSHGASAFFGNEFVATVDRSPGVYMPLHLWPRWHRTVPAWGQAVLLALIAVGTFSSRKPRSGPPAGTQRPGGRLAAAVGAGSTVVLLAWPVVLWPRAAAWLLLAFMIVAGAGASAVSEMLLGGRSDRAAMAVRTAVVLFFLGVFSGLAGVSVPRGAFTEWDPARFPETFSLVEATAAEVRRGDCVAAPINADIGFPYTNVLMARAYFSASGVQVSRNYEALSMRKTRTPAYFRAARRRDIAVYPQECLPFAGASLEWVTSPVTRMEQSSPAGREPVFHSPESGLSLDGRLFVLDAGFRPRDRNKVGDREVKEYLEAGGIEFEVAADFSGGRVYRLSEWAR